jgi:hypothetical protein
MWRLLYKAVAAVAICCSAAISAPALAATTTHAPGVAVNHVAKRGGYWHFTGDTYPVTGAGGRACENEGSFLVRLGALRYQCRLDDPTNNKINLWIETAQPRPGAGAN